MEKHVAIVIFTTVIMTLGGLVQSDASTHRYESGDEVPFYVNKVGPFSNPSETYNYFSLPFCQPDKLKKKAESLGEILHGDHLVSAPYKLEFLVDKHAKALCKKRLTKEEVAQFRNATAQDYYFQMYYDDLPIWGFIGKVELDGIDDPNEYKYHIFTSFHFDILFNKDRVIEINVRSDPYGTVDVTNDRETDVEFLYTVVWKEIGTTFEKRMDKYQFSSYLPHHMEIHWFSILNSCVTIFILISCLGTIYLRVLRRDIYKQAAQDEEFSDNLEETGWKSLHGDVFRFPKCKSLLSSALGCGTQILTVAVIILVLGVIGVFQPYDRGVLSAALVIIYAITCAVAGFASVSFYHQLEGSNLLKNLLLAGVMFFLPLFLTFFFLNTVAIKYGSTAALPVGAIAVIFPLWVLVAIPSLVLGAVSGKRIRSEFEAPSHTTKCPREVPPQRWYKNVVTQMALAGVLPFAVIYVELCYVFASVWGHRLYTIYSILSIVFVLLLVTTALVCVATTYFQLAAEDHRWWWRSFLCGGSTGLYLFGYSFYYYFTRSNMKGFMQTSFFFGYMACISYGVFLMLGTVGFRASLLFVRLLYGSIKCE